MKSFSHAMVSGLLMAVCSLGAQAQNTYFLVSAGSTNYLGNAQSDADASLASQGQSGISSSLNNRGTGFKAMLGYRLTPTVSLEGGYADLGNFSYSATYAAGGLGADYKATGLNISAVNFFPLNQDIAMFGKLGVSYVNVKGSGSSGGVRIDTSDDKSSLGYGVGATYNLTDKWSLRTEWERIYSDVNLWSLGLQVRF